jgi:hypothetical protein
MLVKQWFELKKQNCFMDCLLSKEQSEKGAVFDGSLTCHSLYLHITKSFSLRIHSLRLGYQGK